MEECLFGPGSTLTSQRGCREKTPAALFFKYNSQLGPPYQVLVDTNFINFSIKNKASGREKHQLQHNACHLCQAALNAAGQLLVLKVAASAPAGLSELGDWRQRSCAHAGSPS